MLDLEGVFVTMRRCQHSASSDDRCTTLLKARQLSFWGISPQLTQKTYRARTRLAVVELRSASTTPSSASSMWVQREQVWVALSSAARSAVTHSPRSPNCEISAREIFGAAALTARPERLAQLAHRQS